MQTVTTSKTIRVAALPDASRASLVGLLVSFVMLSGCAVFPMKTRTVGVTGVKETLDFSFIQPEKTTKAEVATKLAWMDSGVDRRRLFWGRWFQSSSGYAYLPAPIGLESPGGRRWHTENLLVEFNEDGTVERASQFSNAKLNAQMGQWINETGEPPLDLSVPLDIEMHVGSQQMTLTDDLMRVVLWNGQIFSVPRNDISQLEVHDLGSIDQTLPDIYVLLKFKSKRPGAGGCKCLGVNLSPSNYLALLEYIPKAPTKPLK